MMANGNVVEQWDFVEVELEARVDGNPFTEVDFGATFRHGHREIAADGFHDGRDTFRVRFSPDTVGQWHYTTHSNVAELDGVEGQFECTPAGEGNHGPVRVADGYHFAYADGTRYWQVGTTCYAWAHQGDELEEQTLATLAEGPFNKLRMCVFPKHYRYNANEPEFSAFERTEDGNWAFARFNPAFFAHFEGLVGRLRDLGIEADLILFHPYDRWGFADMGAEADDRFLRYVVARLSAYRNVWWSLANEFDLMETKTAADWDRFFRIIQESDPHQRLRSVHNCRGFYDHGKPWVTHCSVQHSDLSSVRRWREEYRKPVVVDECRYEGNIRESWGNISAREMVHRFWLGTVGGGYVGHGETYLHPEDVLWWSKGGVLHGESPARIAFLRGILEEGPARGFEPVGRLGAAPCAAKGDECFLFYFGDQQCAETSFSMPGPAEYTVEIIDTWEMTVSPVDGVFSGEFELAMPGKTGIAVRMWKGKG